MTLDEEIFADGRLGEDRELMLYNMSLRQTSQRAAGGREGTHMLLSAIEGNAAYQEMIDRGLVECKLLGRAGGLSTAAATLIVTQKGLRYCVLHAEQIEPRRAYDVAGVLRKGARPGADDGGSGVNYAVLTSGMALGGSVAKDAAVALTDDQVRHFEKLGAQRRSLKTVERQFQMGGVSERREYASGNGDIWSYVVADGTGVQIVGVSSESSTLTVPREIEGIAVFAIGATALSQNEIVEEIVCPDRIATIGDGAFRLNPNLRRLVLPASVTEFQPSWIERCPSLEELVLPGLVEEVTRRMFENQALRRLAIGRGTSRIEPGAFQDARLCEVTIDGDNPFIATDGTAIYSKAGAELIALARPVQRLSVAQGCKRIAKKCCCGFSELQAVELPDTLEEIGPFAFSHAGVQRFEAPPSLRIIGEKAFFSCASLRAIVLNDGLEVIGDSAFEGSAITELVIPASIVRLGKSMTKGTGIVHSGPDCTLSIKEGCADLFLDGAGGLYRNHDDGPHLVQLVDGDAERYDVLDGAVAIDPYAFAYHDAIGYVRVPDSVRFIGDSAFRICKALRHVELGDSVESIGDEAFFDANLEEFRVPASLRHLGERALVTYGAHHHDRTPSLSRVEVACGNEAFFVACGMLCRKTEAGASVVVYDGSCPQVVFPDDITRVEDFAFSNARGIDYLSLNPRLATIGANGLSTRCYIRHIHVELPKPLEGRSVYDFTFPDTPGAIRAIGIGVGGASWVNVRGIVEQRDICLANAHDYNDPRKPGNISAYEQARFILDRLADPVMLTRGTHDMMERLLRNHVLEICVDVALHDDRDVFDRLIEGGYVNAGNLDAVIECVTTLRDAASSAYLLEAKRERFGRRAHDYEL